MLTGIIKATRAHYAALQHKPSPDRVAIDYTVAHPINGNIVCGTVWVIARTNAQRSANLTRLTNRLFAMYPEALCVNCEYRRAARPESIAAQASRYTQGLPQLERSK
jgi:hypothetical protein